MDDGEEGSWLDERQAARVLGLSADGVRKRAIRGLIEHRKANDGALRYLVTMAMVEEASRLARDVRGHVCASIRTIRGHVSTPGCSASSRGGRSRARRQKAERPGSALPVPRVGRHPGAGLAPSEARADRLEAALAEARKGWLERVLEAVRRR